MAYGWKFWACYSSKLLFVCQKESATPYNLFFLISKIQDKSNGLFHFNFLPSKKVNFESKFSLVSHISAWNECVLSGIGCICDPGFDGEFCEITTTIAPPTTFSQSNTNDYDYDYSTTDIATTDEVTEDDTTVGDTTEDTTEDSIYDLTEENDVEDDVGYGLGECENPNPKVITIGNGTILQAYCDEGSLNGTR